RSAVRRYLAAAGAKPPTDPQTGSADPPSPKPPTPQTGSEPKPPSNPQTGSVVLGGSGPESLCEPWKERIEQALAAGLSIQRIHQDLVGEQQFSGSYHSVRRYVLRLEKTLELPFRRLELQAGEEMQVDFGQGAWVMENGRRKRPHLFRVVLSHSRK